MIVRRIISKVRNFIEIRCLFMLLNNNQIKFCIFKNLDIFRGKHLVRNTV